MADGVRVPALHLVDVVAVAADGNQAGVHHLPGLLQGEMGPHGHAGILVGVLAHRASDDENGGVHPVFLQNGQAVGHIAQIAVVKGDDDGFFRQLRPLLHVGPQVGQRHGGVSRLGQGGDLFLHLGGGEGIALQVMVHQDGHLGGVFSGVRVRDIPVARHVLRHVVRCHVDAEIRRNVYRFVAEHPGQRHFAHAVAEMGGVIEIAGVPADGAGGKIPEGGNLRQGGVEPLHLLPGELGQIVVIQWGRDHQEVHPRLPAQVPDGRDAFQALVHLGEPGIKAGIVQKFRIGRQIGIQTADVLHIPPGLVISAALHVEYVMDVLDHAVCAQLFQLFPAVAGVGKQIAGIKGDGRAAVRLPGHGVGEGIVLEPVALGVALIHIEHQIFHRIVVDQIPGVLLHVLHIRAVHDEVVEAGVKVFVQLLLGEGAGGGTADDVGVVRLMVLLQVGEFGRPGVVGLVVGPPAQHPVAKDAEGVGEEIEQPQPRPQQDHGQGEQRQPAPGG